MGIFNLFKGKDSAKGTLVTTLPVADAVEAESKTVDVTSVSTEAINSEKEKPFTVSYATGWPIDVIYGYLHKNYEQKGFDDAMIKSDLAFRDMNMGIIRNKILIVFREINLSYDVKKRDFQTRMDTCRAAGLLTVVADLEKLMAVIETHKEELRHLEDDFRNNGIETSVPLQSYECGFLRGIATIAMGGNNHVAMPKKGIGLSATMLTA